MRGMVLRRLGSGEVHSSPMQALHALVEPHCIPGWAAQTPRSWYLAAQEGPKNSVQ